MASLVRIIFAICIACAVAAAPIGASLAAGQASAMEHCDKKGGSDCPCCDTKAKCPPNMCILKCFKLVGEAPVAAKARNPALTDNQAADPPKPPPGWGDKPHPPPPRT